LNVKKAAHAIPEGRHTLTLSRNQQAPFVIETGLAGFLVLVVCDFVPEPMPRLPCTVRPSVRPFAIK
jgi:hypothetical protein